MQLLASLPAVARSGQPMLRFDELVAHFAEHPQEARLFADAMASKSVHVIEAVIESYDFTGCGCIVDVGGGRGHLIEVIRPENVGLG